MDKEHELAGKVDALLGKAGRSDAADARNVPVLTELVEAPDWNPDPYLAETLQQLNDSDIDALSHEIFARVFDRIDARLAGKLESQLNERLSAQVNAAVMQVLGDMRQDIANEVGDAVNAVLADLLRNKNP